MELDVRVHQGVQRERGRYVSSERSKRSERLNVLATERYYLTLHYSKRFFLELDEKMYLAEDVMTDGDFAALRDLEPVLAVSKLKPFKTFRTF